MIFEVKNLQKSFGEKQVLKGVNFEVQSGSALGLLGRNGAGKTTTLRIIMGVFGGEGEVLIDGKPIDRNKINFGYLPEERGLYPKKQILEQLVYFGMLRGMKSKTAKESALKWLNRLEMGDSAYAKLDTLSKGNQQKIQLACALVTDPEFVILDEPFSGLDPVNAMLLKDVVSELISSGKIVLFSSHQMNYVEEFCESIVILNKGQIVLSGKIKEIKRGYNRKKLVITSEHLPELKGAVDSKLGALTTSSEIVSDKFFILLKNESDKAPFTSKLAELGVDFDGISVYEPSLNDIFVEYTED
jgi:ABC-type uncharacterized transport system, ATPase component